MNILTKEFVTELTDPHLYSDEPWNALVVVASAVLGAELYDYQCEILRCIQHYPRVAVVASRQIGKSVAIAILALTWALSKPNQTILIISTGERQVKELLTKRHYSIKKIFKRSGRDNILTPRYEDPPNVDPKSMIKAIGNIKGLDIDWKTVAPKYDGPQLELDFRIKHENAEEVEFHNGSRIVVVPANPDTASGYTADLLIGDEIAKMPNWPDMQAACFPFVSRSGGKIALFSSYKGKNHWYRITQDKLAPDNPKGWMVLRYPITVNPPPDLEQLRHDLPEDIFNEEYMCIPVDEAHSMFPFSLIDQCSDGSFLEWV
jgi:hypothetical protein